MKISSRDCLAFIFFFCFFVYSREGYPVFSFKSFSSIFFYQFDFWRFLNSFLWYLFPFQIIVLFFTIILRSYFSCFHNIVASVVFFLFDKIIINPIWRFPRIWPLNINMEMYIFLRIFSFLMNFPADNYMERKRCA